jgi:uracil-DNA glycosylase family protein
MSEWTGAEPIDPAALPAAGRDAAEAGADLRRIAELAASCRACDLWQRATQTVFGEGTRDARVMLVGEQPGDQEDLAGEPFVGPAGRMLNRALADAGIDREQAFVTNVVKHFKWRPSGKRRLHERPNRAEIRACGPWLEAELAAVRPDALVLLGATAAQALLGPSFRVTQHAGRPVQSALAPFVIATLHPSAILRARDATEREASYGRLVDDLRLTAAALAGASPGGTAATSS